MYVNLCRKKYDYQMCNILHHEVREYLQIFNFLCFHHLLSVSILQPIWYRYQFDIDIKLTKILEIYHNFDKHKQQNYHIFDYIIISRKPFPLILKG